MILAPRLSSTTSPSTRASDWGRAISPSEAETASTSLNSTWLSVPVANFSTRITSPGATRYCLPPERMTAYIPCLRKLHSPAHTGARRGTLIISRCLLCVAARRFRQPRRAAQSGSASTGKLSYFSVHCGNRSNGNRLRSPWRPHSPRRHRRHRESLVIILIWPGTALADSAKRRVSHNHGRHTAESQLFSVSL